MRLTIYNRTNSVSLLILEPVASTYEIEPGNKVEVEGDFVGAKDGHGEIEILPDNTIALYVAPDSRVYLGDTQLKPNPKY